jgi:hypothetical protein
MEEVVSKVLLKYLIMSKIVQDLYEVALLMEDLKTAFQMV